MPEQVLFINREEEFSLINGLLNDWETVRFLFINGDGGIGKTRFLQEIYNRYATIEKSRLCITEIIDFDDHHFQVIENVRHKIVSMLEQKGHQLYQKAITDYRKMEMANVSSETLEQAFERISQIFIDLFNAISEEERIVLRFDTIDTIEENEWWEYFSKISHQLKNTVIIMTGRSAHALGKMFQSILGETVVQIKDLSPFQQQASLQYLLQKQKLLHIELESELAQKLILLSGGKPILLDLAATWRARGISLDWMLNSRVEELSSLSDAVLKIRQADFKRQLVSHIAQMRTPSDQLILLMSYIYPLNTEMIARFLPGENAQTLFTEAKAYTFVRQLPADRITLHDEMRDMVRTYIWPEVGGEKERIYDYSKRMIDYLEDEIKKCAVKIKEYKEIIKIKNSEKFREPQKEEALNEEIIQIVAKIEEIAQYLWDLRDQQMDHILFIDINRGIKDFIGLFEKATKVSRFRFRQKLFNKVQQCAFRFSIEQRNIVDIYHVKLLFDAGKLQQAKEVCERILSQKQLSVEYRVETLIFLGNISIRERNFKESIDTFKQAVYLSKANEFTNKITLLISKTTRWWRIKRNVDIKGAINGVKKTLHEESFKKYFQRIIFQIFSHPRETWDLLFRVPHAFGDPERLAILRVRANNALGYAYRQVGVFSLAEQYYREALRKCYLENGLERKELREEYGWITDNLAFVLSDRNNTRRVAIDLAHGALKHWEKIGNIIGIGAAHLVLGIAYYRNDFRDMAAEEFDKALSIFKPLEHKDWLGQIYTWRGALYKNMNRLDDAEKDLKIALEIGHDNIKAMAFNRLGRVYMMQKRWEIAEETLQKSLEFARQMPDFIYWLGSVARLIIIAAEQGYYKELDIFKRMVEDCKHEIEKFFKSEPIKKEFIKPDENSLGIASLALARLAFGQNDIERIEEIIKFLKDGIFLVTQDGSYANSDILSRLEQVEQDFSRIPIAPEIIRKVGFSLQEYISEKEEKDVEFSIVAPIMHRWANWPGEENHEQP